MLPGCHLWSGVFENCHLQSLLQAHHLIVSHPVHCEDMVHKKRGAFDLNSCTMRQLVQLSGISQGSARKLVRFRKRQWKKAKRMDAERQTHLKRRHDLMAELREELPLKCRVGRGQNPQKISETSSVPCEDIRSSPVKQMSWLSVSDERVQTSRTKTEEQTGMVNISNDKKTNGPPIASEAALHKPDIGLYEIGGQHICDCSQNLALKCQCSQRGSLSKEDKLFCRVCGAAETCWMTYNQEKLFKSQVSKEHKKTRREHKKASKDKETNSSQGHCVLL